MDERYSSAKRLASVVFPTRRRAPLKKGISRCVFFFPTQHLGKNFSFVHNRLRRIFTNAPIPPTKKPPGLIDLSGFSPAKSGSYTPPFNVIEAPCLGCQRMARRSTTPTIQSKISAKTVSTKIPAITVLISKTPSACRMR